MSEVYTPTRRWCPFDMKTLGCAWTHPALPIMFSLMVTARRKKKVVLRWTGSVRFDRAGGYKVWFERKAIPPTFRLTLRSPSSGRSNQQWNELLLASSTLRTVLKGRILNFAVVKRTFWIHSQDFRLPRCSALCPVLLSHQTLNWRLPHTLLFLPEDKWSTILRNVGKFLPNYTPPYL